MDYLDEWKAERSIPACAGEPAQVRPGRYRFEVYPRVCGGTRARRAGETAKEGLSPRVRGNLEPEMPKCGSTRSIPACAGEPSFIINELAATTVYPRVCGGTSTRWWRITDTGGLSPRVRGNPGRTPRTVSPTGSIPACAGEPVSSRTGELSQRVYPRVCGGTKCNRQH